jgi:hypothetical protein
MDKELALLEDWAVEQIIEWKELLEKQTRATGKAPSDLKRALRFGNELVFNPEAYGNLLERARSQGLSAKQIIQEIRKIETELLNSKKVLMSDWLHHRTAQRTGGDTFLYMRGDARRAAREILRGEGIYLGNVDPNFVSLPGVLHTKKTQGVEKKWFDSLSFDQQKGLYLPAEQGGSGLTPAHLTGASSAQISGTAPTPGLLTAEEGADVVRESALLQRGETAAAEKIMFESGYVEEARKQIGQPGLYTPEGPTRQLVTSEEAVPIFNRLLNFNGGKLHLDKEVLQQMASFPNRLMQQVPQPIRRAVPGGAIVGGAMLYSDIAQAAEGVQSATEATDKGELGTSLMEATAGATAALSAAPGLQPLAIPSMVFGATAGAMRMRVTHDQERERTQQVMAGEVSRYGPTVTQTPTITKPESDYERRRRARTGR